MRTTVRGPARLVGLPGAGASVPRLHPPRAFALGVKPDRRATRELQGPARVIGLDGHLASGAGPVVAGFELCAKRGHPRKFTGLDLHLDLVGGTAGRHRTLRWSGREQRAYHSGPGQSVANGTILGRGASQQVPTLRFATDTMARKALTRQQ